MTSVPYAILQLIKQKLDATGKFDRVGYYPDNFAEYNPNTYCLIAEGGTITSEPKSGNQYVFVKDFLLYIYSKGKKDRLSNTIDLISYAQNALVEVFRGQEQIEKIINMVVDVGGLNYDPFPYSQAGTNKEATLKIITVTYEYIDCVGSVPA